MMLIADSICVKLLSSNALLTGVGNELFYYFLDNNHETKKHRCNILFKEKIHGIVSVPSNDDNSLVICYGGREINILTINKNLTEHHQKYTINDWISSLILYNETSGCLVTAHNIAQHFKINTDRKLIEFHEKSWSQDSSTLYCSKIIGNSWNSTVIFSATALGDIVVWQPINGMNKNQRAPILHRLNGHRGVIFSIDIQKNFMTTTSDDRSVKFWNILRNTTNDDDWNDAKFQSNISVYGHTARVFKSKIINDKNRTFIASVGEDSYFCLFNSNGRLLCKKKLYKGAVIWNLDYDSTTKTVFTTGSDGNIAIFCIKEYLNEVIVDRNEMISFNQAVNGEYISKVKFLNDESIIGLTNTNKLFFKPASSTEWCFIVQPTFKCCVMETFDEKIILAGFENVHIYEFNINTISLTSKTSFKGKMLRSCHFIDVNRIIICDDNGCLFYLNSNLEKLNDFVLPKCRERWTTCALYLNGIILIGDRSSNLHLYQINEDNSIILINTLKNVHGNFGITNLINLGENNRVLTTGHDGHIREIEINENKLSIVNTYKVEVNWVDKISVFNGKLMLFGFNDNHFVCWEKNDGFLFEYECGSGHRSNDLFFDKKMKENCVSFTYVRKKMLFKIKFNVCDQTEGRLVIPKTNWHSKACNSLVCFKMNQINVIVSGGEDNIVKFSQLNECGVIKHIHDMIIHISNIRCVRFYRDPTNFNDIFVISAGGRAQICITKFNASTNGFRTTEVCNFMLKLDDFQRKRLGLSQKIHFDPETRFMCLDVLINDDDSTIFCFIGCSDGFIRKFQIVKPEGDDFLEIILIESVFYKKCILNVKILNTSVLISMSTDGKICFWNINTFTSTATPFFTIHHHDSGINGFDVKSINQNEFYIVTGGDDQQIVLSQFKLQLKTNDFSGELIKTIKNDSIHTAQVTGVIFNQSDDSFYTTGVDQMIYKVSLIDLKIISSRYSCVADIKGLEIINKDDVLVYGCGINVFKCEK